MTTEPDAQLSALVRAAMATRGSTEGRAVEAARIAGRSDPASLSGKVVKIAAGRRGLHAPGRGRYGG